MLPEPTTDEVYGCEKSMSMMDEDDFKLDPIGASCIQTVDKNKDFEHLDIYCHDETSFTDDHPDSSDVHMTNDDVRYSLRDSDSLYSYVEGLISVDEDVSVADESSEFLKALLEHHSQDDRSLNEKDTIKSSRPDRIYRDKNADLQLLSGLLRINVVLEEKGYSSLPLALSDIDATSK